MDVNLSTVIMKKVEKTMINLEKNNMEPFYVENEEKLLVKLGELLKDDWTVSVGGSMTLFESGVIDYLREGKYKFLDRYEHGLKPEDIKNIFRRSFSADAYLTSTNALLESGELYNVDGNGNRVAAMMYGPDNVIVIVGVNKLVSTLKEAIDRNRKISAPAN